MARRLALGFVLAFALLGRCDEAAEAEPQAEKPQEPPKEEDTGRDGKSRKELAEGHVFCEYDNCYELLGVKETSGPIPIKRAYRRLASKWHPDRCESGNVAKCREMFPKYANAYEVLSNAEMRKNYDYVMAHPYEFPGFFLKYSRPTYAPKSDLRLILLFVVFGGAAVQHYLQRAMHEQQVRRLKKDPRTRYNERVKEAMAKSGGGSAASPAKKSGAARGEAASTKNKGGPKGEALEKKRAEAEALVDAELASELPAPPVFADTMAVAVFKLPLTLCGWAVWTLRFSILRQAYGPAEQRKLTCRALGVSDKVFAAHSEAEQEELIGLELWVAENLVAFETPVAGEKSSKQKREARWRKKNPGGASVPMD